MRYRRFFTTRSNSSSAHKKRATDAFNASGSAAPFVKKLKELEAEADDVICANRRDLADVVEDDEERSPLVARRRCVSEEEVDDDGGSNDVDRGESAGERLELPLPPPPSRSAEETAERRLNRVVVATVETEVAMVEESSSSSFPFIHWAKT